MFALILLISMSLPLKTSWSVSLCLFKCLVRIINSSLFVKMYLLNLYITFSNLGTLCSWYWNNQAQFSSSVCCLHSCCWITSWGMERSHTAFNPECYQCCKYRDDKRSYIRSYRLYLSRHCKCKSLFFHLL